MKKFVMGILLLIMVVFMIWAISNLPGDFTYSQKQVLFVLPVFIAGISLYLMASQR